MEELRCPNCNAAFTTNGQLDLGKLTGGPGSPPRIYCLKCKHEVSDVWISASRGGRSSSAEPPGKAPQVNPDVVLQMVRPFLKTCEVMVSSGKGSERALPDLIKAWESLLRVAQTLKSTDEALRVLRMPSNPTWTDALSAGRVIEGAFSSIAVPSYIPAVQPAPGTHRLTEFSVALVVLLHFITLGIFSMIRFNLMHGQLPKVRPNDPSAGKAIWFMFIPFFNFYWIFFSYNRLCLRIDEQRIQRGLPPKNMRGLSIAMCTTIVIPYVGSFVGFPIMAPIFFGITQSSVNELIVAGSVPRV